MKNFLERIDKIFDVSSLNAKRRKTKSPKGPMDKSANDAWNLSINPDDLSDRDENGFVPFPDKKI